LWYLKRMGRSEKLGWGDEECGHGVRGFKIGVLMIEVGGFGLPFTRVDLRYIGYIDLDMRFGSQNISTPGS